jgi:hypothetical protein
MRTLRVHSISDKKLLKFNNLAFSDPGRVPDARDEPKKSAAQKAAP